MVKSHGKGIAAVRSRVCTITALIACICIIFWHDLKQILGGMDILVYHVSDISAVRRQPGRPYAYAYETTGRSRCCRTGTVLEAEKKHFFLPESALFQNISRIEDELREYREKDSARKIDLIFVIASKDLPERRKHMERLLKSMNAQQRYVFVDEITQSFVSEKAPLGNFFSEDDVERHKTIVNASFRWPDAKLATIRSGQVLNPGEKSLSLAHYSVWEAIAYTPWIQTAMILEDDVFPIKNGQEGNILGTVDGYIASIESEYSQHPWLLYPGSGKGDTEKRNNFHGYKNNLLISKFHMSKYSDTYVMNRQAAMGMVTIMLPFSTTVDWQMTWGSKCCNITVFHTTNPVTRQGSGKEFASSLRP